jgi:2-phospho-L-lactate guanylyltransferase
MTVQVIIPVKARARCKTRLRHSMTSVERLNLARQMLSHVIDAASNCERVDELILLSPERDEVAVRIRHFADQGRDLNASLQDCMTACARVGTSAVLILPADLPHLQPEDIDALVAALGDHDVALAPDRHGVGTNAIALRWPCGFRFAFGRSSFNRHLSEAVANDLSLAVIWRAGLSHDVDLPEDLVALTGRRDQPFVRC